MNLAASRVWQLRDFGQRVWVDELRREMLSSGELARLIEDDGICGLTSNPSILQKALSEDGSYRKQIEELKGSGATPDRIYETLVVHDVRQAADQLHRVFRNSDGHDGFVSLECPPKLAFDSAGTLAEAKRLWGLLDRPNVMIKIPATHEGLLAVRQLIADGINVNATLVFGVARYREVVDAFMAGLEDRKKIGRPVEGIVSVASLFVSRIDTLVDRRLHAISGDERKRQAEALLGKAGVEVARLGYQVYKEVTRSARWLALEAHGARPQRLVWASTSTKDPAYSDVKYVDELIGPDTIATVGSATLAAYRDHGRPSPTLEKNPYEIATFPGELLKLGIDLAEVSRELEADGIRRFVSSMQALLDGLAPGR